MKLKSAKFPFNIFIVCKVSALNYPTMLVGEGSKNGRGKRSISKWMSCHINKLFSYLVRTLQCLPKFLNCVMAFGAFALEKFADGCSNEKR